MKHKRELSQLAKEQMFDSYMKSAIRNYCKEFVRNYFKERGNAKEVPLDEFTEELITPAPDNKDLLSLFLLSTDLPLMISLPVLEKASQMTCCISLYKSLLIYRLRYSALNAS